MHHHIRASAGTYLASKGDPEGFCAEDPLAGQCKQGGVDCHGQLHGQLRGDDRGDDHDAVEDELEAVAGGVLCGNEVWASV